MSTHKKSSPRTPSDGNVPSVLLSFTKVHLKLVGILSVGILSGWDFVHWGFVLWDFVQHSMVDGKLQVMSVTHIALFDPQIKTIPRCL